MCNKIMGIMNVRNSIYIYDRVLYYDRITPKFVTRRTPTVNNEIHNAIVVTYVVDVVPIKVCPMIDKNTGHDLS